MAANGVDLGGAVLTIYPVFDKNFGSNLEEQILSSVNGEYVGGQMGQNIAAGMENAGLEPIRAAGEAAGFNLVEGMGTAITGAIGTVAKIAGTIATVGATAFTGFAVKGGIDRQLNIEQAQAKLIGLGSTTEDVALIMENALGSVKGTAFSLDEAVEAASLALSAGVAPGADLERHLKLVADSATIAGTSLGDMGRILSKTISSGEVSNDVLGQFADRGIGALNMLAEAYGKTTEETFKAVSEGKISAQDFARVLEVNLGGSALKSGETTTGSFKNMQASLSRLGVTLTEGVFPAFKLFFNQAIIFIDGLSKRIAPLAATFSLWFAGTIGPILDSLGQDLLNFIDRSVPFLNGVLQIAASVVKGLMPAGEAIGNLFSSASSTLDGGFLRTLEVVASVITNFIVPAFVFLVDIFRVHFLPAIKEVFSYLAETLFPAISGFVKGEAFKSFLGGFEAAAETISVMLVPAFKILIEVFSLFLSFLEVFSGGSLASLGIFIASFATGLIAVSVALKVAAAAQAIFNMVVAANPYVLAITAIVGLVAIMVYLYEHVEGVHNAFNGLSSGVGDLVGSVADGLAHIYGQFDVFGAAVTFMWEMIINYFEDSLNAWSDKFDTFVDNVKRGWESIVDGKPDSGFFDGFGGGPSGGFAGPQMADGGTVLAGRGSGPNGGTFALLGERGRNESVVDERELNTLLQRKNRGVDGSDSGGDGLNVTVNGYDKSPEEMGNAIWLLKKIDRL